MILKYSNSPAEKKESEVTLMEIREQCFHTRNIILQEMKTIGIKPPAAFVGEAIPTTEIMDIDSKRIVKIAIEYIRTRTMIYLIHELIDLDDDSKTNLYKVLENQENIPDRMSIWAEGMGFPIQILRDNIDFNGIFEEVYRNIISQIEENV